MEEGNEQQRILSLLNESLSDDQSDSDDRDPPYYSGLDSDDTDVDPHYVPTDSTSDDDESDEEDLERPFEERRHIDNLTETIEAVIAGAGIIEDGEEEVDEEMGANLEVDVDAEVRNDVSNSYHVICGKQRMKGTNGHLWCNKPATQNTQTRAAARNVVHIRQGPKNIAKDKHEASAIFQLFFTQEIRNITMEHTNSCISRKQENYKEKSKTVSPLTMEEFNAFLGILILTACQKDNHMPTKVLFDSEYCGDRYKATMSRSRFDFLLESLRFDVRETREERKKTDRFAPIREIWDLFISSCRDNYKPGTYVTIDEQLLAFRGRSKFRMYIPNKPSKYGLKIVMMCDSGTKYMVDAMPYLGKGTTPRNIPQAMYFVKELTRTIYGSNRNVTMDNWFTTVPLASDLLAPPINLTLVGTVRRCKPEIPPEMKDPGTRKVGSSMFCFDGHKTMVSFKAKKKKVVLLLSTCHDQPVINPLSNKPEIIECYNSTKGAVDTLDQMCGQMSCSRKTKRWPLCIFYGMINIMIVNSYVIYVHNKTYKGEKPLSRRDFAKELHNELVKPWLERRLQYQFLAHPLRQSIAAILRCEAPVDQRDHPPVQQEARGRKICGFCPSKKRRMTKYFCGRCSKAMCGEHQGQWCFECVKKK